MPYQFFFVGLHGLMPSTATRFVAPFAAVPTADLNDGWEIVVFQNDSYFGTHFLPSRHWLTAHMPRQNTVP